MRKIRKIIDIKSILLSFIFWTAATCIGTIFQQLNMQDTDIVITYLLCVLLTARLTTGYIYGIIVSFGSMFTFNYLFIDPAFHFEVEHTEYILLFICMIVATIMTSMMTSQMKTALEKLKKKEAESRQLYQLSHSLIEAQSQEEIIHMAILILKQFLGNDIVWLYPEEHTDVMTADPQHTYWKISGKSGMFGYVRVPAEIVDNSTESRAELFKTMTENFAMAIDRMSQMEQRRRLDEKVTQERYRSNLLRSISHDIRTPLSGIIGNTEMMLDMTEAGDTRYPLEQKIHEDAKWLCSMVENILNLTRMQEGLVLKKEYEALEEIVESSIRRISSAEPYYDIETSMPEEMLLVLMDARLIQQVIMNLLDNAVKHTQKGKEIRVTAEVLEDRKNVCIRVQDRGCGIPKEILEDIFEPFYTADNVRSEVRKGIGLGLSICKTIVKAHGGFIIVKNRLDGEGAEASFTLPFKEE